MMMRSSCAFCSLLVVLLLSSLRVDAQAPPTDVDCRTLPFTACLLNLGCIYDAVEGSCKTYSTEPEDAKDDPSVMASDEGAYEFSYEDFMTSGIDASPPMADLEE